MPVRRALDDDVRRAVMLADFDGAGDGRVTEAASPSDFESE